MRKCCPGDSAFTFDGSSSNLQVTRTAIKSQTESNSGQILPVDLELLALECLIKCCEHDSAFIFYLIFFTLADRQDRHKISDGFDFGPDQTIRFGVTHP